jgi:hypothetical protein
MLACMYPNKEYYDGHKSMITTKIRTSRMAEPAAPTADYTTIYNLSLDILGLCHSFLGVGHFGFIAPACKIFKQAYLSNPGHDKVTSGESITSSISCARKHLEDEKTSKRMTAFFWYHAIGYGCLDVLEWAYQQGYSYVWEGRDYKDMFSYTLYITDFIDDNHDCGKYASSEAAKNGQLDILKWLIQYDCEWDTQTCRCAAESGHTFCLQYAIENGCPCPDDVCSIAARGGNLSCLQ